MTAYDITDLMGVLVPRNLLVISPKNHLLQPASNSSVSQYLQFTQTVYSFKKAFSNLSILPGDYSTKEIQMSIIQWLKSMMIPNNSQ